ncbi:MAG: hypothetical protein ABJO01_09790 [Parasphingorhabdus sp.]|uniref:hypothetical protein n=1 Tax=Parasphingorhabdus sp. TaxID=2709688 RepID=UPI0032988B19
MTRKETFDGWIDSLANSPDSQQPINRGDAFMTFDIGRVMTATFAVMMRHPVVFFGLSLLVAGMPQGMLQLFAWSEDQFGSAFLAELVAILGEHWMSWTLSAMSMFFVMFLFGILLQAMMIVATIRDIRNQHVDIGLCFGEAVKRFLPLVGLTILSFVAMIFGLFLFIIPGVILFLMWCIAAPILVVENLGIMDSLKRSAELTSGSKGMIFLLFILFMIASGMISGMGEAIGLFSPITSIFVTVLVETVVGAAQAAGIAALYVELRTVKEGPFTDRLSDIFA